MADNNDPGSFDLHDITIEGRDFSENFVTMMFQEHLFSPIVRSKVRVNQYEGAQNYLDGKSDSTIAFSTPNGDKRTYVLGTNGVGSINGDENQISRNFTVDLVSKHGLINNSTPNYQKSFKNRQISDVIGSIAKEGLGLEIPFNIDETRGLQGSDYQPIILTQKSPLMHIDDLRKMAVSKQDYDGFLLFSGIGESGKEELNFKSIYNLIKADPVATITNFTKMQVNSELGNSIMNNVIEMWYPKQTSSMEKRASFSKGTTRVDMNAGTIEVPRTQVGEARQEYGSGTSLNPGKVSGYVGDPYNGMPGTSAVYLEDSRRPDTMRSQTAAYTEALFSDMMQNKLTIKVPGNSNLKVGQVINFDMKEHTDIFPNSDTKFSGKNLIAGITSYIGPVSDNPRYVTYIDLVNIQTINKVVS